MDVRSVAVRVAAKTYGDALKTTGDELALVADQVDRTKREILGLHGRKDEMSSCQWHQLLMQLVSQLQFYKRRHWELETLLRRMVSEPDNKSLWESGGLPALR